MDDEFSSDVGQAVVNNLGMSLTNKKSLTLPTTCIQINQQQPSHKSRLLFALCYPHIIGGSVVKAGDLFLEPARQTAPKFSFVSVGPRIRIVAAALGDDAPLLGCAWLARDILAKRSSVA